MGYLKDKNTYVTKDGKSTKRGLWANVYLKKKREGKLQEGGTISPNNQQSILGYKDTSPYKNADSLLINSPNGEITMDGVSKDLIGIDEYGNKQYMKANSGNYKFKGNKITEIPVNKNGGRLKKYIGGGAIVNPMGNQTDLTGGAESLIGGSGIVSKAGGMSGVMPYMGAITGGLDLAMNWDKKDNTQKGEGIGSTAGNIAGNILLPGMGGQIGSTLGGLIGKGIGSAMPVDKPIEEPIYQNMRGIAVAEKGLKLNKQNINNTTMNLRQEYDKYVSTPSGKVLNDFSQGGLVKGKSHSQGGVPTYKMQAGGMMPEGMPMGQEPEQIAEVEGEGVSPDGIAVDGGERIFSVEDTQMMEDMVMQYQESQDENILMELGQFVVEAIMRQEQVNPSQEMPEEMMGGEQSMPMEEEMQAPPMKKGGTIFDRY